MLMEVIKHIGSDRLWRGNSWQTRLPLVAKPLHFWIVLRLATSRLIYMRQKSDRGVDWTPTKTDFEKV